MIQMELLMQGEVHAELPKWSAQAAGRNELDFLAVAAAEAPFPLRRRVQ